MRKIREILLTEYIGAILIGVLIAEAFTNAFAIVIQQITYYSFLIHHELPETPFRSSHRIAIVEGVVRITLYLISVYLLVHWLYGPTVAASRNTDSEASINE